MHQLLQQRLPVLEVQVLGYHGQVGEEVASGDAFFPGVLPEPAHLVVDGVDGEGDEVEHQQHVGQAFVAVSEVVLEVVFVVLEFVEGFVFNFPSASSTLTSCLTLLRVTGMEVMKWHS